jgi:hypothetical protein
MERFVRYILAGGIALVAGLWVTTGFGWGTPVWIGGAVVALLGSLGLAVGIGTELTV